MRDGRLDRFPGLLSDPGLDGFQGLYLPTAGRLTNPEGKRLQNQQSGVKPQRPHRVTF
jgi:hypothetical protein